MIIKQPSIVTCREKKIIGLSISMSLSDNRVPELWKTFMPRRNEISNAVNTDLISMAKYPTMYFANFGVNNMFEKWAGLEVNAFESVPEGLDKTIIPEGLYAVFYYRGLHTDSSVFQFIFQTWLPQSDFELDQRPHFEILGEKYKNNDPASEEEIWIPISVKRPTQ